MKTTNVLIILIIFSYTFCNFSILAYGKFKSTFLKRIVGGEIVTNESFPFQVAILKFDRFSCGGSIISAKHVLTAGHCAYRVESSQLTLVVGTNEYKSGDQVYSVSLIFLHNDYDQINLLNDIAVLFVKYGISLSERINIIQLSTTQPSPGSTAVVAGWGVLFYPSSESSLVLRRLNVTIMRSSDCITALNGYPIKSPAHICSVGRINQGPCNGDSGSPLTQDNKQYGIVSWGLNCATAAPSVYVNVANYITWLKNITENAIFT